MLPLEAWAPLSAVGIAVMGGLTTLLIRERRKNGNGCYLKSDAWSIQHQALKDAFSDFKVGQEGTLNLLRSMDTHLAVIKDRLPRGRG